MPTQNALIFVHGMIPLSGFYSHQQEYDNLWSALVKQPQYGSAISAALTGKKFGVEWGHLPGPLPNPRDDQKIAPAEDFIVNQCAYGNVQKDNSPQNHLHLQREAGADWIARQTIRPIFRNIKEQVAMLGLTDVVYYCSADGEAAVRRTVYQQILTFLDSIDARSGAKLHVIAQSLGVTVAFDFLFGLFNDFKDPDFTEDTYPADDAAKQQYLDYRALAQAGTIQLGSFNSTASQLPLTVMRKQLLVNALAANQQLDPKQIGVDATGPASWYVYYDQDDILGYPTRRLFAGGTAIEEFEVNTGWKPDEAHAGYWIDQVVIDRMAKLIASRL